MLEEKDHSTLFHFMSKRLKTCICITLKEKKIYKQLFNTVLCFLPASNFPEGSFLLVGIIIKYVADIQYFGDLC